MIDIDQLEKKSEQLHDQLGKIIDECYKEYPSYSMQIWKLEFDPEYKHFRELREQRGVIIHQIHDYYFNKKE